MMKFFIVVGLLSQVIFSQVFNNIIDYIEQNNELSILNRTLDEAGLKPILRNGNFTILAPNDFAFNNLPSGTLDELLNNIPLLQEILTYHVLLGFANTLDFIPGPNTLTTINGQPIVTSFNNGIRITDAQGNGANIVDTASAQNGFVHMINAVLQPNITTPTTTTVTATTTTVTSTTTSTTTTPPVTNTGTTTTSGPSLPEENAKAIQELKIRVAALERAVNECGCGTTTTTTTTKAPTTTKPPTRPKSNYWHSWGNNRKSFFGRKRWGHNSWGNNRHSFWR